MFFGFCWVFNVGLKCFLLCLVFFCLFGGHWGSHAFVVFWFIFGLHKKPCKGAMFYFFLGEMPHANGSNKLKERLLSTSFLD